jgi:hypothetical protein
MKKHLHYFIVYTTILVLFTQNLYAQLNPVLRWPKAPNGKIVCFTDEMEKYRQQLSGKANDINKFENWIATGQKKINAAENFSRANPIIYSIPVIFHVIHNGEAVGTGRNISKAFIDSQLIQLNNDFRRKANTSGFNTHVNGADIEMQFTAATLNPTNGVLGEPGIDRINRNTKGWTAPPHLDTYMQSTVKPNSIWNPDKYLNIWICDLTDASGLVLGYAQQPIFPGNIGQDDDTATIANTDGIVLHYSVVGSSTKKSAGAYPFDEGRILTHEVGHFFGLRHVWGEGNCDRDDYVFDTPRQNDVIFGCAVTSNTCDDTNYGSPYDSVDMVRNYMQYSDNACVNIFTTGQKNRMRIVMGAYGTGSPRRESLRFSDRSMTKPKISFIRTDTAVIERTSCNFPWGFLIPIKISAAPTGTTYASLTITGNTNGQDYTITPDSLSFSATDSADKYFAVVMNPDAVTEGHEQAFFTLSVNDTNSIAAPDAYELIIWNDDNPPIMGKRLSGYVFAEDFETPSTGWIKWDYIKGANRWLIGGSNGDFSSGKSAYISKDSSALSYNATSVSHTIIYHEIQATNWDSLYLSFYYKCNGQTVSGNRKDFGKLMYSLDSLNFFQVNGTTDFADSSNATYFSSFLPSFLWNRKFYLGFYWQNDTATANNPPFAIDDILISGKTYIPAFIHTTIDTAAGYDERPVGPMETVNFYDRFSGDILATIENLSGHNYGCVTVAQDRAGTGAQYVYNDPAISVQNKLFDKTYKITPQYNNATGNYKATFYLTHSEVTGWMLASGNNFNNAFIIKDTGHISNTDFYGPFEQQPAIKGNYLGGVHRTITATFNTGFSGFGFGRINTSILPVHLISFTATEKNKTALLNWKVDNEINILRYAVQQSNDGSHFTEIGSKMATNASGLIQYTYIDAQPAKGWNYYRLAMYDNDGRFKFSQIERLYFGKNIIYTIAPNPFSDKIILTVNNKEPVEISFTITDASGKTMAGGNNPAIAPGQIVTINTQRYATGVYYLKINSGADVQQFKIVKQ